MWNWLTDKNNKAAIIVGLIGAVAYLFPIVKDSVVHSYKLYNNPNETEKHAEKIETLEELNSVVHRDLELARDSVKFQFEDVYKQLDSLNKLHNKYVSVQKDADALYKYCQTLSFLHQSYMNKTTYRGITYLEYNAKYYYYDSKWLLMFPVVYSQREDTYYYHTLDGVSHWCK